MTRCECERGRTLAEMDLARTAPPVELGHVTPMITDEAAMAGVLGLTALKFFPSEPIARMKIADEFKSMCHDDEEVDWLVTKSLRLFSEWSGMSLLRQVYCSRYVPLDRVKPIGTLPDYPDGIPSQLPPGNSFNPPLSLEYRQAVRQLAAAREEYREAKKIAAVAIPTTPIAVHATVEGRKPITQADIDKAVAELHAKKGESK